MRIFNNFGEMYSETLRDLVELGIEVDSHSVQGWNLEDTPNDDHLMKEIIGYAYRLTDWVDWKRYFKDVEWEYVLKELRDRVDEKLRNPGRSWESRASLWEPMRNVEGKFDYTYNERIRTQLIPALQELAIHPNSRQVIVAIYQPHDQKGMGGKFRIPCSLHYQFLVRENKLHLIYHMRSCDYFNHFKFDVMLAVKLMEDSAYLLEREPGTLTHVIGSFHCFKKDWKNAGIF